jgi:integrase
MWAMDADPGVVSQRVRVRQSGHPYGLSLAQQPPPKVSKPDPVPVTIPAVAAVALAEHLAEYAEPGPDGLVFQAPESGYLRRSNLRRRWWLRATRAAGVEGLRFHDLRHSAVTLALAAGANTRELMESMGHTSPQVALRYQHVMAVDLGCWWSGRPDLNRRPPAPKLAHSERLAKPCFCRSPSSGRCHIRVS